MYAPAPVHGGSQASAGGVGLRPVVSLFTGRCIVSIHRSDGGRRATTVLEFAILGLLQQCPMHGYELRKELAQLLGGLRSISFGSLYPALKRLHAARYITTADPEPKALPPADAPPLTDRR